MSTLEKKYFIKIPFFRRKQYLINPRFQLTVILFFLSLSCLVVVFNYLVVCHIFNEFLSRGEVLGLPKDHIYFKFIGEQFGTFTTFYLISSLILITLLIIGGIIFSHKIAGPMYRLRIHLDQLTETGEDLPLKFRSRDFFQEIPQAFNRYLQAHGQRQKRP